mgnify:CR=1 FL=1
MTEFKEYINNNPAFLEDQEVPAGHEARFEAKLDAMLESAQKTRTDKASRRKRIFTGIFSGAAVVAAAAIAAVIFINRPADEVDWFAGVADDPRAVYLAYSEKVTVMYGEILSRDLEDRWERTVGSIAEETVPMIDQLPDELDDAAKAIILKEYYGKLLNGLDKINKIKEL